jgi:hypothetical protein
VEPVIDTIARRRMAELARHLAAGLISNDEFEDARPDSSEKGLYDVYFCGLWPLYDDLFTHKLRGEHALTPEGKKWVARIILFLRSDVPYRYPPVTGLRALAELPLSLITLGWFGRVLTRHRRRHGEQSVWPFYSKHEYERALRRPIYLSRREVA